METQGRKEVGEAVVIAVLTTLAAGIASECLEAVRTALAKRKKRHRKKRPK